VNPMVAVLLGFLLLGERPEPTEYLGMLLVIIAVALVTSSQVRRGALQAEIEAEVVKS
jgi:drug/metabolite transporter (DMT)-like permease